MGRNKSMNALTLEGSVKDPFAKHPPQEDNTPYSLTELPWYTCDYAIKPPVFKLPVEKVFDLLKNSSTFTVVCSCKTLHMKITEYTKNSTFPPLE
jgi:hypothetical protein